MTVENPSGNTERTEKGKARDLILDAAEKVFGESGIKGATTREIARVAGVNETTLFRNFSNKEVLLKAVVEKHLVEAQESIYGTDWSYNLPQDLLRFANNYTQFLTQHEGLLRTFLAEAKRLPEELRQIFNVPREKMCNRLADYFKAQQQKQVVRPELDPLQITHAYLSVLLMNVMRSDVVELPYSKVDYFKTVVDIFIRGIQIEEAGG